jgi:penicillin-binding protein 1A
MKLGRFSIFLLILFSAAFLWGGGGNMIRQWIPAVAATFSQKLPPAEKAGAWKDFYRIIALKSAVNAKLDKKNYVPLQQIPLPLQQAMIAVEDNRFYHHYGIDIEGIIRASLVNMQTGTYAEGGSTITQQLVKNLFLTQQKTLTRKAEEVVLALDMELRYSKEDILEMYLNTIYFGSGAYGIHDAAKIYFNKKPADLTLPECAMLAGLPNAPSLTSPYVNFRAAKERQRVVLDAMVKYGYIGQQTAENARLAPIVLAK